MKRPTYDEQLKRKEWEAKRKKIIKRDGGKCTACDCKVRLQVHHKLYISGRMAWDYPDGHLITLCFWCHEIIHDSPIQPKVIKDRHPENARYDKKTGEKIKKERPPKAKKKKRVYIPKEPLIGTETKRDDSKYKQFIQYAHYKEKWRR